METILIETEQLNIGMTSLLRGQNTLKKIDIDTTIQIIMKKL